VSRKAPDGNVGGRRSDGEAGAIEVASVCSNKQEKKEGAVGCGGLTGIDVEAVVRE
jgi:hypothetical protein